MNAAPSASPATLPLRAADGHTFDAAVFPAAGAAAPVLLFLSALGTPSRFYGRFAASMAAHGVTVCTPDWRGIGSSSIRASRTSDFGYRELIERDAPAAVAALGDRFPGAPLFIGGHSLGGQIAALVAARQRDRVAGFAGIASGTVHAPCYPLRLRAGIRALATLVRASRLGGHFPGRRLGFGGREAHGVMRDWLHTARHGDYRPHGSELDYEALLRAFDRPALALCFSGDTWAPASISRLLLSKMPQAGGELWHWGPRECAGHHLDHFSWARQPEQVAPAVADWLLARASL